MSSDKWASWLKTRRDGGDPEVRRRHAPSLVAFRDGVLDRASISEGDVVLDIGTGSGLIGFGALDLIGDTGQVIFSDISAELLDECRRRAGDDKRCSFVEMSADDLRPIPAASVDVVTTRSVLMYLADKRAAFTEIARVLRPGGRLSIFEPVNSFLAGRNAHQLVGLDLSPIADLAAKVLTAYAGEALIMNFDERDLLAWAEQTGFTSIEMDYRAQVDVPMDTAPGDWETLKRTAPNPLVPTYEEAIAATLNADEQDRLENFLRARFAAGAPRRSSLATVFLRAVRGRA